MGRRERERVCSPSGNGGGPASARWTTLLVLGFQTVLSSFFISILGMHRK